ncbi:SusD/RagB family nutrient-binding outer membrane lipoprotein [Gelidibacter gilvus]|uniref:SusD/RagB family nutrient-binding outer membrane lipoprotein n=1 Tax=Gelidibacter gilvus TaxID=59602 RepID=A0A4Q0XF34_9FLAO|nr:SusD/RagB family nutrient-binding outer membrane lipoprotein [Gelidibacter gilvus]RXJ49787.1 SusD/RagB family nutrient-binding outer membrane lipoprotein [Gelidibacter gilvus]
MNKINILIIAFFTVITACTNDFEETNTNPNTTNVGQIKASGMFEPLLYNGANFWLNYTWYWNNELVQFTAFTGGTTRQEHRYFISDANWQSVWNAYSRYGNNVTHMYDLSIDQKDRSLEAISMTLKVLYMSNLTDMFGDVPYSEAFTARKPNGTTKPQFESQKEVYEQMFADLNTANDIYATNPVFVKPALDGMYGGSMDKWRKFNNSLYLRLLMRVSGRPEMNAQAKISEVINSPSVYPIFTSNADNATVIFSGNDPYRSQFADTNEGTFTSSGRKLTEQLIKMTVLKGINDEQVFVDPRLPIIGKKNPSLSTNPNNLWKGTIAGVSEQNQSDADRGSSWLNTAVLARVDAPGTFMDFAEIQFILAEAALKGWIAGGDTQAKQFYENAVKASVEKWGAYGQFSETAVVISEADITELLQSDLASWDKATNKAELIGNQKYLALFWIGMEAYHEYRRTGFPELTIGDGAIYNDYILPTRFAYPTTTLATNSNNVQEAIGRMGPNTMKTPVWWSKQAIAGN